MSGSGFVSGYGYKVGYYDNGGTKVSTDTTDNADSAGNLSSSYTTKVGDATGSNWHAQVYNASLSPPSTYDATNASAIVDDSFTVSAAAPEFPAGIILPFAASLILYAYMRKKVKFGKK